MKTVTIAKGDGIGPEIMDATLRILNAAQVDLQFEEIVIGEQEYLNGNTSGIPESAWESIRRNKLLLKAPITTPQGGGYKSLNVTMRKMLGLYANVRPCMSFYPYVATKHPKMDLVIIRENEEDLYAGIEHQQTDEVVQCLKLISRPGCEKIVRYAFEYARNAGRKKVTCFSKDNIMKQTDGLFRQVFNEIAAEYPDIENDHWIIDIGSALLAEQPESFDVIVTLNLYGDIISDIAAQITGSVGLAGSANIGQTVAMFEAIHGSAPMIAGKNIANPTGLLQAAVMLLNYVGQGEKASEIQNALLATIENGIHTADIYKEDVSKEKVGTKEFADAVIAHLGQAPKQLNAVSYSNNGAIVLKPYTRPEQKRKELKGVDVFVHWNGYNADELAAKMNPILPAGAHLSMITNRGIKVWPNGFDETFCTDHWRCRIKPAEGEILPSAIIPQILSACLDAGIDTIKTENLYDFDGKAAYSLGQGQ